MFHLDLPGLLDRLPAVRREVLRHTVPWSCIETSRIVELLLADCGLKGRLIPVEVHVVNAAARGLPSPDGVERRPFMLTLGEPGLPAPPHRWAGHLAVLCQDMLIDASIDQAHRPEHGILIESPIALPVGADFERDGGTTRAEGPLDAALVYFHRPGNTSYLQSPAWRKAPSLLGHARRALRSAGSSP